MAAGVARRPRRRVVVSAHLDDAVLSLGASIARAARSGERVEILTVFAGDPCSELAPGGWDERASFTSEGEAARVRREEDAAACAVLGAVPVWRSFGWLDYDRRGTEDDVRAAVTDVIGDADDVLLPGWPLTHPDHEWLVRTLLRHGIPGRRLGFYVEQPYALRLGASTDRVPGWVSAALGSDVAFERTGTAVRDVLAKRRAVRCYRSQLPLLRLQGSPPLGLERFLASELRAGGEGLGWLPRPAT